MKLLLNRGYTLIEILVALSVFAILATITGSVMIQTFNTRHHINSKIDQLNAIQIALILLQQDTEQAINRPIYGDQMLLFPAFTGEGHYFEFTRGGLENPLGVAQRSTLKRVAYVCNEGRLIRRSWFHVDTPQRQHFQDKILLDDLDQCSFAYLNHANAVLPFWNEETTSSEKPSQSLPTAIQISLSIKGWGNMSLLFAMQGGRYAQT